jgi:hypothetical protein
MIVSGARCCRRRTLTTADLRLNVPTLGVEIEDLTTALQSFARAEACYVALWRGSGIFKSRRDSSVVVDSQTA